MVWSSHAFADHQRALERLRTKEAVIADLIAGRVPLLEAAARFEQVESRNNASQDGDGERWCRTVIGWTYLALSDQPERAAHVTEQLELELQHFLAHPTGLRRALAS